ncbi:MAG: hypothetical protein M1817_005221 [Caeruleum heppii]|nr:MAG: hypothetical protein M1817_005221 [Caeruleum heppii]
MPDSALVGFPPLNDNDLVIIKGLMGMAGSTKYDKASQGYPWGVTKLGLSDPSKPHDSKGPGVIAGMSVAMALVVFVTVSRLMVRKFHTRMQFGWDDWMIIPAAIFVILYQTIFIVMVVTACVGKHVYDCTYANAEMYHSLAGYGQVAFFLASSFVKISMILFFYRLTGMTSRKWRMVHNTALGIIVSFLLASLFTNIFACSPPKANFGVREYASTPLPTCVSQDKTQKAFNIFHVVTDFLLLCVPIIVLSRLHMSWVQKLRLMAVFALGAVSCIAAFMRLGIGAKPARDRTYDFPTRIAWTIVDITAGVIVASLPALHSVVRVSLPEVLKRRLSSLSSLGRFFTAHSSGDRFRGTIIQDDTTKTSDQTHVHRKGDVELGSQAYTKPQELLGHRAGVESRPMVARPAAVRHSPSRPSLSTREGLSSTDTLTGATSSGSRSAPGKSRSDGSSFDEIMSSERKA